MNGYEERWDDRRNDRRNDHRRDDHRRNDHRRDDYRRNDHRRNDHRRNDRHNDRWGDRQNDRWDERRDDRRTERWDRDDRDPEAQRHRHQQHLQDGVQSPAGGDQVEWGASGPANMHLVDKPLPPPLPPSPVIVAQLSELAKSHDLEYDEEKGISDVATLNSKLNVTNLRLIDKDIRSWSEMEEHCQRTATKLGIFSPEEKHRQPFSLECMRQYISETEANKTSGGAHAKGNETAPTDAASSPVVGVIPYKFNPHGDCKAEDPRLKFGDEYELLSACVAKARPVPAFADPQSVDDSPTHSWSRSPVKARSEALSKGAATDQDATGTHDKNRVNMERGAMGHANSHHSLHALHSPGSRYDGTEKMELEEGYFRLQLLNGEPALLQHGEIVDLIRAGKLPDGWSAYRESDKLWISVSEAQISEATADMQGGEGGAGERDPRSHEEHKIGAITLARKDQPPKDLQEEFARTSLVAMAALGSSKSSRFAPRTLKTNYFRKPSSPGPASLPSDFSQAAQAASDDLLAYDRVLTLRARAKLLCGAPKPVDPSTRARIKENVIQDRSRLRDIASGALQKALRLYIQRKAHPQ